MPFEIESTGYNGLSSNFTYHITFDPSTNNILNRLPPTHSKPIKLNTATPQHPLKWMFLPTVIITPNHNQTITIRYQHPILEISIQFLIHQFHLYNVNNDYQFRDISLFFFTNPVFVDPMTPALYV